MPTIPPKPYLGDGLYAELDSGYQIKLSTPEGNEVYLEPQVFDAFILFAKACGFLKSEDVKFHDPASIDDEI